MEKRATSQNIYVLVDVTIGSAAPPAALRRELRFLPCRWGRAYIDTPYAITQEQVTGYSQTFWTPRMAGVVLIIWRWWISAPPSIFLMSRQVRDYMGRLLYRGWQLAKNIVLVRQNILSNGAGVDTMNITMAAIADENSIHYYCKQRLWYVNLESQGQGRLKVGVDKRKLVSCV